MKRALSPSLNPTGIGSAVAAVYAGVVMIYNALNHHAVIDPQVVIAAVAAGAFLYSRMRVTPVADPKDGNGQPLVTAPGLAAVVSPRVVGSGGVQYGPPLAQPDPVDQFDDPHLTGTERGPDKP